MAGEIAKRIKHGSVEHKSVRRKLCRMEVKSGGRPKKKKVGKYN